MHQARQNRYVEPVAVNAKVFFRIHVLKNVALIVEARALGILHQLLCGVIQAATFVEIAAEHAGTPVTDLEVILAAYRAWL